MGISLLEARRREILANQPHPDAQTGTLLTWTKCAGGPLKSCLLTFGPVQEGTGDPSPSNVRPISGRTGVTVHRAGKNLLDNTAAGAVVKNVTFTVNQDGTITATGTASATAQLKVNEFFPVVGQSYKISGCTGGGSSTYRIAVVYNDGSGGYISETLNTDGVTPLTLPSGTKSIGIYCRIANGQTVNGIVFKPMIQLASDTNITYEPYTGQTVDVQFPDSAGTVYGGTLDLLSGTLTATWGALDLGSLTYAVEGDGNGNLFSSNSTRGVIKPAAWSTQTLEALCPIYTPQTGSATYKGTQDGSIGTDGNGKLYIYDSTKHGMTASEFKASLSGVMLIYALRTPVVHQVDPATIRVLTGRNIIWSSADEISATCYTY